MSASYSDVPAGGQINIPPAIPTGMLYRVKQIQGVSKQTLKNSSFIWYHYRNQRPKNYF